MRVCIMVLVAAALAGCGDFAPSAAPGNAGGEAVADGFPAKGQYRMVRDRTEGSGELRRLEMDVAVDASTRDSFELLVAGVETGSCRDRKVDIGNGSFSVKMTCDGPAGDVLVERNGSYSSDSIDMSGDTDMGGMPVRESVSYRLKSS